MMADRLIASTKSKNIDSSFVWKFNQLIVCGINLENSCFSHGQLYVACSRVGKLSTLFIFAPENRTKNVVSQKALN